jgi:CheY-like chemotaxis protein
MRVVEKSDAPSALEYLRSDERFDIALLDLMMPGMDGIELTRAMRAFLPPAALPVIMASSFSQRDAISQARAAGVQATMNKPVRQSQLHDTLLRVLTETGKFSLPETGPDHPPAHVNGTLAVALGAGLPLRILVAEDQPVNQRIVNLMLKKLGYAADIVGTGREAADAVRVREYDVVLMDMHMPVMDGFEAAGEIRRFERETGRSTGVHIIALTADALDGDREKCLAQGMNDYLSKPLHPKDLRSALQRYAQT